MRAGFGTDHLGYGLCKYHFGATKMGSRNGRKLMIRDRAKKAIEQLGVNLDHVSPELALMVELRRAFAICAWLEMEISNTEMAGPSTPPPDPEDQPEPGQNPEVVQSWMSVFLDERKHLAKVAKMALDAGIAERTVKVLETQAAQLAQAIRTILGELQLTPDQATRAPHIVRTALLALESTGASPEIPNDQTMQQTR